MLSLEQLYFELIMMQKKEYNEKISEETKKNSRKYIKITNLKYLKKMIYLLELLDLF